MELEKIRKAVRLVFDVFLLVLLIELVYVFYQINKHPEVLQPIIICDPYASLYQNKLKELNPITNPFGFVQTHEFFRNLSLKIAYLNIT